eukprot:4541222-Pyramimonas_sp.AAC.1
MGHRRDTGGTPRATGPRKGIIWSSRASAGGGKPTGHRGPPAPGKESFGPAAPQPQESFPSPAHAASPRPHA